MSFRLVRTYFDSNDNDRSHAWPLAVPVNVFDNVSGRTMTARGPGTYLLV